MSRFVFLDLETTGLVPQRNAILEVALVVTDDDFEELSCAEYLINPGNAVWDAVAQRMHEESGLVTLAATQGLAAIQVRGLVAEHLRRYAGHQRHLAGYSVHFDRSFLAFQWPEVERLFHHRQLDVSSVRMLGERVVGEKTERPPVAHRAMADVRASIAELQQWAKCMRRAA